MNSSKFMKEYDYSVQWRECPRYPAPALSRQEQPTHRGCKDT